MPSSLSYSHVCDEWPIFSFFERDAVMALVSMAEEICKATDSPLDATIDVIAAQLQADLGEPTSC